LVTVTRPVSTTMLAWSSNVTTDGWTAFTTAWFHVAAPSVERVL
jgi:hypothetical protein